MELLLAVIDDLYSFAMEALFGPRKQPNQQQKSDTEPAISQPDTPVESTNIEEPAIEEVAPEEDTFRSVSEIVTEKVATAVAPEAPASVLDAAAEKNTVMYAGSTEVSVFKNPTEEFDSVIAQLPYGQMVMVLKQQGRWASIAHDGSEGWVLREDLVDRAAYVYPSFIIGERNTHEDPNTIRLRGMINDMFEGGRIEWVLQAPEYVTYRLLRKGLSVAWPNIRPRVPGVWHKILKGVTGVHVGIIPKTGSIMEYMHTEDIGHLAYVEAVFPNETINISEVNFPDGGIYNERVLTRDEWKELKPIFIQVT